MSKTRSARMIAPHGAALKSLGVVLFCGGPGNRRDANRFLSLSQEDREWADRRAHWLYDHNLPYGDLTVTGSWKIAIDEALDPDFSG